MPRRFAIKGVFAYMRNYDEKQQVESCSLLFPCLHRSSLHFAWAKNKGDWWGDGKHPQRFMWIGKLRTDRAVGASFHFGRLAMAIYIGQKKRGVIGEQSKTSNPPIGGEVHTDYNR